MGVNLKTHTTVMITRKDKALINALKRPKEKASDVVARSLRAIADVKHRDIVLKYVLKDAKKRRHRRG